MIVEDAGALRDGLVQRGDDLPGVGNLLRRGAERGVDRLDLRRVDDGLGRIAEAPRLRGFLSETFEVVEFRPDDVDGLHARGGARGGDGGALVEQFLRLAGADEGQAHLSGEVLTSELHRDDARVGGADGVGVHDTERALDEQSEAGRTGLDAHALLLVRERGADALHLCGALHLGEPDALHVQFQRGAEVVGEEVLMAGIVDANVPARGSLRRHRRKRPGEHTARAHLLRRRYGVLVVVDDGVSREFQRPGDHAVLVRGDVEPGADESVVGHGSFQYDRGIPRTFCPRYARTRLLLTGAVMKRRVSRNLRSMSYSFAKP